jgi:hypothetical protein
MILAESTVSRGAAKRFRVILIKPSHYDDDGYVIGWYRSTMPSNSLASVYGLVMDAIGRNVLGDQIAFDVTPVDETNTRVRVTDIVRDFQREGTIGFVGLVGVQYNQYRARYRAAAARGRHSSGVGRVSSLWLAVDVSDHHAGRAERA